MRVGRRLEEDAARDAEDGGVRADAEREREERDGREAGLGGEPARGVADILNDRFGQAAPPNVVADVLETGAVADAAPRLRARVGRRHPLAFEALGQAIFVKLELVADFAGDGVAAGERAEAIPEDAIEAHSSLLPDWVFATSP